MYISFLPQPKLILSHKKFKLKKIKARLSRLSTVHKKYLLYMLEYVSFDSEKVINLLSRYEE